VRGIKLAHAKAKVDRRAFLRFYSAKLRASSFTSVLSIRSRAEAVISSPVGKHELASFEFTDNQWHRDADSALDSLGLVAHAFSSLLLIGSSFAKPPSPSLLIRRNTFSAKVHPLNH
jgi:hypothetical protein